MYSEDDDDDDEKLRFHASLAAANVMTELGLPTLLLLLLSGDLWAAEYPIELVNLLQAACECSGKPTTTASA